MSIDPINLRMFYSRTSSEPGEMPSGPGLHFRFIPPRETHYSPNWEVSVSVAAMEHMTYEFPPYPHGDDDDDDQGMRHIPLDEDEAARRLAACWNALRGLDTDSIERIKLWGVAPGLRQLGLDVKTFLFDLHDDPVSSGDPDQLSLSEGVTYALPR